MHEVVSYAAAGVPLALTWALAMAKFAKSRGGAAGANSSDRADALREPLLPGGVKGDAVHELVSD
jgi:hypothetical protein